MSTPNTNTHPTFIQQACLKVSGFSLLYNMDIPVMLTPFGDTDTPKRKWFKEPDGLTMLVFFS
ncbi:hypothetical protein GXP67_05515 [Rhodocytophaga rosea]|uniref:Uncharacterized protein n=1 Tax=Rhodocytophaga rosea TaxID=2704465 RepID=A0A6C0GEB3_9BACT|nr:hypothetical protein [Rhodocytophaga rosea]QHT66164.1 hypothetical protein GXP67_05515 [Rhodocytophaga rosea]